MNETSESLQCNSLFFEKAGDEGRCLSGELVGSGMNRGDEGRAGGGWVERAVLGPCGLFCKSGAGGFLSLCGAVAGSCNLQTRRQGRPV